MAKKMRKILALVLVLAVICANFVMPAAAAPWSPPGFGGGYEWYEVYVQGSLVASGQGSWGDVYYMGTHYIADAYADGHTLYWYIDPQGSDNFFDGSVDLSQYITIPEGFTVNDITIEEPSIGGVNDATHDMYDNATISITIKTLKHEDTGDLIPADSGVVVNHKYYTRDLYTGETQQDGTASEFFEVKENEGFTAIANPTYGGNSYTQTTADSALTITVAADPGSNVINIEYLRTIDTTPAQTSVTVNHNYYTKDMYTGETVLDGSTSASGTAYVGDSYTASPVVSYGGNTYTQTTDASALTITAVEDASKNVINIDYLRTIDTAPKKATVTVNHHYYTEVMYTWECTLDGTTTETVDATEFDTYTAVPVTSFGGNDYEKTTHDVVLTINVSADAEENVIDIEYLRAIDTSPRRTNVTVVHNYYTKDLYTKQTVQDGFGFTVNEAKQGDLFTAETITQYNGQDYTKTTDDALLTITVDAVPENNLITINYLRTIDTTPVPPPSDPAPSTNETTPITSETEPSTEAPVENDDIVVLDGDGLVEIEDEDVPLADVPQTGDMSLLWVALSAVSAGGAILLNRKRKED